VACACSEEATKKGETRWRRQQGSPLSSREGWLSNGRQVLVLHFRPTRWSRHNQVLEMTSGELLPGQPVPLLKRRRELPREEAIRLWTKKRQQGWTVCPPQWQPPIPPQR